MHKGLITYLRGNQKIALLAVVSLLATSLYVLRVLVVRDLGFMFLNWNLFLAWIPLLFIKWVWQQERVNHAPVWLLFSYLTIWLLFFPNAPYIITDLMHLRAVPDHMVWFDALMIFTFALAGFLTGLYSIRIVHRILASRWNGTFAWGVIGASMVMSGFRALRSLE
jgi:uncharacterized membrane protein